MQGSRQDALDLTEQILIPINEGQINTSSIQSLLFLRLIQNLLQLQILSAFVYLRNYSKPKAKLIFHQIM